MKLALVHDYLTQLGGAEKVLENLQGLFPESPIFVLMHNKKTTGEVFPPHKVFPSWLQKMPLAKSHHQFYLTLMPQALKSYDLADYDVVLSSASSLAKGVAPADRALHVCYCHTPTRYLWHDAVSYVEELGYNKLVKKIIPLFLNNLRHWDLAAAVRVDHFIANSRVVQQRIKDYYCRESEVIYPPVETERFHSSRELGDYYLIGGRLVAYKKYDLAITAFNKLGIRLKIFGQGPDFERLKKMAASNVKLLGPVSDQEKAALYAKCRAFIYPQEEDFGITAVEAMAAGRPVIAYAKGGALETVVKGLSGVFFEEQTWEGLADAVIYFKPLDYDSARIRESVERFNSARFKREISAYIERAWAEHKIERVFKMKRK